MHPPAVSGDLCWKGECKAKLPTKDPLSWPPVLTQLLLQVKSSPVSYLKPPETKNLNYPKCFLKAKSTCGPRHLCKLQKREMFSLALLRREFLVFWGKRGEGRSPQEKQGGRGIAFCLAISLPWLTAADRRDMQSSPYRFPELKRELSPQIILKRRFLCAAKQSFASAKMYVFWVNLKPRKSFFFFPSSFLRVSATSWNNLF